MAIFCIGTAIARYLSSKGITKARVLPDPV
jgi:hypothetical protein